MLKIELKKVFFMASLAKLKSNLNDNHTVYLRFGFSSRFYFSLSTALLSYSVTTTRGEKRTQKETSKSLIYIKRKRTEENLKEPALVVSTYLLS